MIEEEMQTGPSGSGDDANDLGQETPPTFRVISSQDELDRVLSDRLRRERAKYADYAALRTKAEEFDKLADSQKSESERASARAAEAEAKSEAMAAKFRGATLRAEVAVVSSKLGIVDADVALALIGGTVEFDNAGEPLGVEKLLIDLIKSKPFLKAQRFEGADGGRRSDAPDPSTMTMADYMQHRAKRSVS